MRGSANRPMNSGIARLHALYLSGECSPVEIVEQHLALAADLGRRLNAFTCLTGDAARTEAQAAAERYARGEALSVLDGVPVTVKDNIHLAGFPTSCASAAADSAPATSDAAVVARLRRLGAVVIGKNNLLEYAFGVVHPAFGAARNPWNLDRSACGSSSGSAVAVAAGIGFASIGTDTAGSVRCPAAFCGIIGLKPSYGVLPTVGVVPLAPTLDHVGVLARTVEDTRLLYDALSERRWGSVGNRPLRLGVADLGTVAPDVRDATAAIVEGLRADGVELVALPPFPWREGDAAAQTLIAAEALEVHAGRLRERWQDYSLAMRTRLLGAAAVSGADYVRALRLRESLRQRWQELLREEAVDAVLGPTAPVTAPPGAMPAKGAEGADPDAYARGYRSVYALLGVPAVSVPVALDRDRLPIAVQLAAAEGEDGTVLDVAHRIEAARGPWPWPPHGGDPMARLNGRHRPAAANPD
jgi:aspartyl-tRNA(Asn)/glutamyl-tRNA(Gln) amidotransferase subunit A